MKAARWPGLAALAKRAPWPCSPTAMMISRRAWCAAATAGGMLASDCMSPTAIPPLGAGQRPKSLMMVHGV